MPEDADAKKRGRILKSTVWEEKTEKWFTITTADFDQLEKLHSLIYPKENFKKTRVIKTILVALLNYMDSKDIEECIYKNTKLALKKAVDTAFPYAKKKFSIKLEDILLSKLGAKFNKLKVHNELHTTLLSYCLLDLNDFYSKYIEPYSCP